jgi:signal transduction histidine kinase
MDYKILLFISTILFVAIILEPWLILIFEPSIIYLFNILASSIFIIIIFFLTKRIKNEQAKKEVISLTAHQLSAPLSSIKWSLGMILNDDFGKIAEEQKNVINGAYKKNNQLIYLVEDLLNIAKIENGKYLLEKEVYNIEDAILYAIDLYQDEITKKKISFNFEKPEKKLPETRVDDQKIKLAIQNLLDNAIKYTPVGGTITISVKTRGKNIEFKIHDSGIGIEKKQNKKIFNKFFRGSNAIKEEPMGYGLGLFFVKEIVTAHGGKVWFNSKKDEGSDFYFSLPIKK